MSDAFEPGLLVTQLHALGGIIVMMLALGYGFLGVMIWLTARAPRWVDAAWLGLLVLLIAESALGLARAWSGGRPSEFTHWIYGGVSLALLLASATFVAAAPPRLRGAVMAGSGLVLVLLGWRLAGTG